MIKRIIIDISNNYKFFINIQKPSKEIQSLVLQLVAKKPFIITDEGNNNPSYGTHSFVTKYRLNNDVTLSMSNFGKSSIKLFIKNTENIKVEYEDGTIQSLDDFIKLVSMTYTSYNTADYMNTLKIEMEDFAIFVSKYYNQLKTVEKEEIATVIFIEQYEINNEAITI